MKKIISLILLLVFSFTLLSCSNDSSNNTSPTLSEDDTSNLPTYSYDFYVEAYYTSLDNSQVANLFNGGLFENNMDSYFTKYNIDIFNIPTGSILKINGDVGIILLEVFPAIIQVSKLDNITDISVIEGEAVLLTIVDLNDNGMVIFEDENGNKYYRNYDISFIYTQNENDIDCIVEPEDLELGMEVYGTYHPEKMKNNYLAGLYSFNPYE